MSTTEQPAPIPTAAGGELAQPSAPPDDSASGAISALRSLQAERYELVLRRLELRVTVEHERSRIRAFEEAARTRFLGGVQQIEFARATRRAAELAVQAFEADRRLRFIDSEIAGAIGTTAVAIVGRARP